MNLWWVSSFQTYVLLKEQALTAAMSDKLAAFRRLYFPDDPEALQDMTGKAEHDQSRTYHFQPLPNIHLDTTIKTKGIGSNPVYSYILAAIGGCILLLASINFTMLTISRSHFRAKDVGVRKVVGARRYQLMLQHWTEAILLCGIAFLLACILSGLVLPLFNDLAQKSLSFMTIIQGQAIVILVSLVILIGILAGAYPALILSGLSPLMRMKGAGTIPQGRGVSKVLLGIQFVLPLVFLTVTLVMIAQLRFLQQKDLGFQPQQVLVIENPTNDSHQTFKRFAQQAERLTGVSSITATNAAFTRPSAVFYMRKSEEEPMRMTWAYQVKANYFELLDIPLVAGRTFNEQRASDATEAVIVNETFVSDWGLTDPIGQQVEGRTIIGVVPDFQYQSLKGEVEPLMFTVAQPKHSLNHILVKLQMDQAGEVIPALATLWEGLETALPFQYSFLDQDMAALYEQDVRWMRIIQCIAVVSISIACLGLIGMIGLVIARRTKEIGIRKVLGASVHQLWWLLSSTYIRIVVIATLVAIPIANYLTGEWLQNFAYRIKLPWWLFALASILFLLLTVLSVGQLIWKAATRNPVESLRYE
jgi:putative ABC transport system permease protein